LTGRRRRCRRRRCDEVERRCDNTEQEQRPSFMDTTTTTCAVRITDVCVRPFVVVAFDAAAAVALAITHPVWTIHSTVLRYVLNFFYRYEDKLIVLLCLPSHY
jgi:hypothetical protein